MHGRHRILRGVNETYELETAMKNLKTLSDRYLSLWNEPDLGVRRKLIRELWAPDGAQVLVDPPQEIRHAAVRLRFSTPTLEVHGYDALEARVTTAYEMFVEPGEFVFRARGNSTHLLRNVVTVDWAMVSADDGAHAGGGVEVLDLDDEGRIRTDYQFIER
jgi:hypothetical protein